MYEAVWYKKPFLKDVIFRIDFGSRIDAFTRNLPPKLATAALKRFPLPEPQKAQSKSVTFLPNSVQTETAETMEWVYHGRNREKTLTITAQSLFVSHRKYESFEKLHEDLDHTLSALYETQQDLSIARVGLRYVNILDIPTEKEGENPLAWSEYVNEQMLGIIDMHKDADALSRVFHIVEFNYDGQLVKFQFGIANPDYPAPIKRKQFILDIDSFFVGALTQDDIPACINSAHDKIQALFEESITDKTRQIMQPASQA